MEKNKSLQNISNLYDKKNEYMNELLKVSGSYSFSGVESEIDAIIEFIDTRQKYIDEIDKIDGLIKSLSSDENIDLSIFQKKRDIIKKIVDKIIQLDEEKKPFVGKLLNKTVTENKKFQSRKAASVGYMSGIASYGSSSFDTKK